MKTVWREDGEIGIGNKSPAGFMIVTTMIITTIIITIIITTSPTIYSSSSSPHFSLGVLLAPSSSLPLRAPSKRSGPKGN